MDENKRCKVEIKPDDNLGLKLIIWGCEEELKAIREIAGGFTMKWLDEKIEHHEWSENDEEPAAT